MNEPKKSNILRTAIQLIFALLIIPLLPLTISGDWSWLEGWVNFAVFVLGFIISRGLAARVHPDLLTERARFMDAENTKPWDKVLAPLVAFGSAFIFAVAGFDRLYGWSSAFSAGAKIIALIVMLAGYALGSWAIITNRFFSGTVRIQTERGHHVVTTGPYRYIRHPGYSGVLFVYLLNPIFLDSVWGLVPAVFALCVIIVRTALEDKTLQAELLGYAEYAQKTRYRLFPWIW